jgi:predicted adenylyl cyclase CyaB
MVELELKSVVADLRGVCDALEQGGAKLRFHGRLEDRRYDRPDRALGRRDHLLRLRTYHEPTGSRTYIEWKGPTTIDHGYKRRDELGTEVLDGLVLATMIEHLGYVVFTVIDRQVWQYELADATVRLERYPRMDDLVEVEGTLKSIEHAIAMTRLPREGFSADRLPDFVRRFEARTGARAALSDGDLAGGERHISDADA